MSVLSESCSSSGHAILGGICRLDICPKFLRDFVLLFQCVLFLCVRKEVVFPFCSNVLIIFTKFFKD